MDAKTNYYVISVEEEENIEEHWPYPISRFPFPTVVLISLFESCYLLLKQKQPPNFYIQRMFI